MTERTIDEPSPVPAGLYIVATPLGNARDITLRALDVLRGADLILCEDTRVTRKLLTIYGVKARLQACYEHNEEAVAQEVLQALAAGKVLALVSDAGTPVISDPGYRVIKQAVAAGYAVHPVPGASAPIAALSASGLPSDRFTFLGFLPAKAAARRAALASLSRDLGTIIVFESPKRLASLLNDMASVLGSCRAVVAREMTKKFEEIRAGTPAELAAHFAEDARGECVVLFHLEGGPAVQQDSLDQAILTALEKLTVKDAALEVSLRYGLSRKDVYARALQLRAET
jgi:16S rRNA (cytidine1402-2'-O)-methyltransferase